MESEEVKEEVGAAMAEVGGLVGAEYGGVGRVQLDYDCWSARRREPDDDVEISLNIV